MPSPKQKGKVTQLSRAADIEARVAVMGEALVGDAGLSGRSEKRQMKDWGGAR